jgi:hypothetical protein
MATIEVKSNVPLRIRLVDRELLVEPGEEVVTPAHELLDIAVAYGWVNDSFVAFGGKVWRR